MAQGTHRGPGGETGWQQPWHGVAAASRMGPRCRRAVLTQLPQPCGEKGPWLLVLPGKGKVLPVVGSVLILGALPQPEGPGVLCICAGDEKGLPQPQQPGRCVAGRALLAALEMLSRYFWQLHSCDIAGSVSGEVREVWQPRVASLIGFCLEAGCELMWKGNFWCLMAPCPDEHWGKSTS